MATKKRQYTKYYEKSSEEGIPRSTLYKRRKLSNLNDQSNSNLEVEYDAIRRSSETLSHNLEFSRNDVSSLPIDIDDITMMNSSFAQDFLTCTSDRIDQRCSKTNEADQRSNILQEEACNCSKMNVGEILLIFMNIAKKHSLTWVALLNIFEALNFIMNRNIFPVTKYMLQKLMEVKTSSLTYHIICSDCNLYIGKYSAVKSNINCTCGSTIKPSSVGSFFIESDLKDQLEKLFSNPAVVDSLQERFTRKKINTNNLEDIYDGRLYQSFCKSDKLNNINNLSYTFNTDGCQAADHSKVSVWPIYLMIHELPDYLRKKYMLLAGLWVSKTEPEMNIFLQPFVQQANALSSKGFQWFNNGKKVVSKLFPLGCCVDSVARCAVLNMKKFNGISGCTYCDHPTVNVNGVRKYPMISEVPKERTDENIKDAMFLAFASKEAVTGVKGPSSLMYLKHFDLVNGMVLDFMHSCLLGVTQLHAEILLTNSKAEYYVGSPSALHVIDERLLSIKPPSCIGKIPRSIKERNNWKASEWLSWLLYYAIPCLKGLLPKKYVKHLALFVTTMNILLSDSISENELKTSRKLLIKFVYYFGKYFGNEYMHYNVHLLLHVCNTVHNWGPLWADSTFPFENENKNLLQLKKSNHHIAKQILIRLLTYQQIPQLEAENFISENVKNFCKNMRNQQQKKVLKIKDCTLLGIGKNHEFSNEEKECLSLIINVNEIKECKKYKKMIYQNCRYTTCFYNRSIKTNDSIVQFTNNEYGIVIGIYVLKLATAGFNVFIFYKLLKCSEDSLVNEDDDVKENINFKRCTLQSDNIYANYYSTLFRPCIVTKYNKKYYISSIIKGAMGRCIN